MLPDPVDHANLQSRAAQLLTHLVNLRIGVACQMLVNDSFCSPNKILQNIVQPIPSWWAVLSLVLHNLWDRPGSSHLKQHVKVVPITLNIIQSSHNLYLYSALDEPLHPFQVGHLSFQGIFTTLGGLNTPFWGLDKVPASSLSNICISTESQESFANNSACKIVPTLLQPA